MQADSITCQGCGEVFPLPARCRFPSRPVPSYCSTACHNQRQKSDPTRLRARLLQEIQIDPETGCWLWTGSKSPRGYGKLKVNGRDCRANRVAAHVFQGFDLNDARVICHRCDRPACINPDHLFPGTHQENIRDRDQKGRTARQQGTRHGGARLTDAQVRQIRALASQGRSHTDLAKLFPVGRPAISLIVEGKTWKHLL